MVIADADRGMTESESSKSGLQDDVEYPPGTNSVAGNFLASSLDFLRGGPTLAPGPVKCCNRWCQLQAEWTFASLALSGTSLIV